MASARAGGHPPDIPPRRHLGGAVAKWGGGLAERASIIADSGVFSTAMTEVADPRFLGTALSAKMAIGFALTVVSIQFTAVVADLVGWQYAFLALVPGPIVGVIAMFQFRPKATP